MELGRSARRLDLALEPVDVRHPTERMRDERVPLAEQLRDGMAGRGADVANHVAAFADDVRTGRFPNDDESYHVSDDVAESLELYGSTPPPGA